MRKVADMLKDDTRVFIIKKLMEGKKRFSDILKLFYKKDSGLLNYHLKLLIQSGLINKRGELYEITTKGENLGLYTLQFQSKFLYPIVVVCMAAFKDSKLLLGRHGMEPYKGYWFIPGGIMKLGETIEKSAVRQMKQWFGAKVKFLRTYGVYPTIVKRDKDIRYHTYLIATRVKLISEPKYAIGEHDKFGFFSKERIKKMKIAPSNIEMIKDVFADKFHFKEQKIYD